MGFLHAQRAFFTQRLSLKWNVPGMRALSGRFTTIGVSLARAVMRVNCPRPQSVEKCKNISPENVDPGLSSSITSCSIIQ